MIAELKDLKVEVRIKYVVVLLKRGFAVTQGEDHTNPDILVKHTLQEVEKHVNRVG